MELLQKISKKCLSLFVIMFMMTMGVVSCESCGKAEEQTTGSLEIGVKDDKTQGIEVDRVLMVKATKLTNPAELKLFAKLVSNTSGGGKVTIGAHTVEVDKDFEGIDLYTLLGMGESDELKEDEEKSITVKFSPGTENDLTLHVKIQKGDEVVGAEKQVEWTKAPVVAKELKASINEDLTKDTVTVTVEAAKQGEKVEAADLNDLVVKVTSNQQTAGETATIVGADNQGVVKIEAADIDTAGVVNKVLQVKRGTKDTELTIVVSQGTKELAKKEKIKVPAAAAAYALKPIAKIEDGTTKVTITVIKGTEDLDVAELAKLKLKIARQVGSQATIGGIDNANLELKDSHVLTISTANKKEASVDLTIDPKQDKKARFELELVDEKDVVILGSKQTLEWENGAAVTVLLDYDKITKIVKAIVTNPGNKKLEANQATLTWDTGNNDVEINGNRVSLAPKNVPEVAARGGSVDVDLGAVTFVSGAVAQLTVTLKWDQLESDKVEKTTLAENEHVITALNAKNAIDALRNAIDVEISKPGLGTAKASYDKLDGELQKITDAQQAVGGNGKVVAIDNSLADATVVVTAGKKAYDDAITAQTVIAQTAKNAIDALKVLVDAEVTANRQAEAKNAYDKLDGELQKITDAQQAVGGNGKVVAIDNLLADAMAEEVKAKNAGNTKGWNW